MSAKTKIIVVKAKELLYTALFIALGIVLILLFLIMFLPEDKKTTTSTGVYMPGVYTSSITLGENVLDVAVAVDTNHITSVTLHNLNDSVSAMYPLLEPSIESINAQLKDINSIDDLTMDQSSKYTGILLTQAIKNALEKAQINEDGNNEKK